MSLEKFDTLNKLAVVAVVMLVIGQLLFVYNMVRTLQGAGGKVEDPENVVGGLINETKANGPNVNTGLALGTIVLTILASAFMLAVNNGSEPASAAGTGTTTTTTTADPGAAVFQSSGCSGCHTLAAAGAAGTVGPNFDQVKPTEARVKEIVTNGVAGTAMQSYKSQLTAKQIDDLSKYIAENAGK